MDGGIEPIFDVRLREDAGAVWIFGKPAISYRWDDAGSRLGIGVWLGRFRRAWLTPIRRQAR